MKFPDIKGKNLEGKIYNLPSDLEGEINFLIIAFKRFQQSLVDEWVHHLNPLLEKYKNLRFYEIPTLSRIYLPSRFFIDGGMRAGIPDKIIRKRTITVYIDKKRIKNPLKIIDEDYIYLFLINKSGEIFLNYKGDYTQERKIDIVGWLQSYFS